MDSAPSRFMFTVEISLISSREFNKLKPRYIVSPRPAMLALV
jgi:hypothetical protein